MATGAHPIPVFRDAEQYRGPLAEGHEIIRPKPRRPGGEASLMLRMASPYSSGAPQPSPGAMVAVPPSESHDATTIRQTIPVSISSSTAFGSLKPVNRDLGGSVPVLKTPNSQSPGNQSTVWRESPGRSPTKERLVQSQMLRGDRDRTGTAWEQYCHGPAFPASVVKSAGVVYKASSREVPPVQRQTPTVHNLRGGTGAAPRMLSPPIKLEGSVAEPQQPHKGAMETSKSVSSPSVVDTSGSDLTQQLPERDVSTFPDRGHRWTDPSKWKAPSEIVIDESDLKNKAGEQQLTVQPAEEEEEEEDEGQPAGRTPESTDCGSLGKSSSDGDPVLLSGGRRRTPAKSKLRRRNLLGLPHHLSAEEIRLFQRRQDPYNGGRGGGGSSSDETRSSGHASMSDGHTSSSSSPPALDSLPRAHHQHYRSDLKSVPEDERLSASVLPTPPIHPKNVAQRRSLQNRPRHRTKDDSLQLEPGGAGLEDIKAAIEQLTLRSHVSSSYSTSTYSSMSGSEGEPTRRLLRHSSLETIGTNVTSADEFVWVDSHNRLVELQHLPWSSHEVLRVLQNGRARECLERVSMETVPRLSYLLQRALVRVGREAQRFSRALGMCSKQEVSSAFRAVLAPTLADSCIKSCLRAAAMYTVSGDQLKQSKSARAGLQLSVGRFHRWMCDIRLGKFIHEYAAVYLTAGMENLLEEMVLQCLPSDPELPLTATVLEHAIANNGDLWGLLQPYSHLNAGRTATGALALPNWPGLSSAVLQQNANESERASSSKTLEQSLLTTCVGSIGELKELLGKVVTFVHRHSTAASPRSQALSWGAPAVQALFYFMRCSQLEHAEHSESPVQELMYERPYIVLPPLSEWIRVATVHTEHRYAVIVDKDDVMQAARLLLPGMDCPVRGVGQEELMLWCNNRRHIDTGSDEVVADSARKFKVEVAFRMLSSGRSDLVPHALQLLPSAKINTVHEGGLTPLMLSCIGGDESTVGMLLEAGADIDAETPPNSPQCPSANPETQHWTAITYSTMQGHLPTVRTLLESGANVEGGARLSEDKPTVTPLQLAAASGNMDIVGLLLSYGAHPFLSTNFRDSLCYSGSAQRGCYSAISVAAAHGHRAVVHKLLSHPVNLGHKEVLSLEEILAEGANQLTTDRKGSRLQMMPLPGEESSRSIANLKNDNTPLKLSKTQIKGLQEAMYHSAENGHLEITLELRNLGVPWTLHCWMHTLATSHEQKLESIIDQLLQDFLQVWPDDYSTQFVDECLPLLFTIFRYSKNEGTTLLLADIFSTCYGREPVKDIHDATLSSGTRIDPKFVNNPELSDVQFRVEGRVFYAHKIVLVTSSPRFKSMLSSKFCEGNPPIVQINDIRYDIFQMVMHHLYNGRCDSLEVDQNDVLELMAAANFFQLDGLLRFCEARCSTLVDLDNIVSMYIHAKVYNAVQLLEYCQGFLLQNMVALLTYDDSVRRLIFGKKLHNHDVLAGLLLTLQARIRTRSNRVGKK